MKAAMEQGTLAAESKQRQQEADAEIIAGKFQAEEEERIRQRIRRRLGKRNRKNDEDRRNVASIMIPCSVVLLVIMSNVLLLLGVMWSFLENNVKMHFHSFLPSHFKSDSLTKVLQDRNISKFFFFKRKHV